MGRPDSCPDCGASCTMHTGSYCHECGTVLTDDRRRALVGVNRITGQVTAVMSLVGATPKEVAEFKEGMAVSNRDVEETTVADARERMVW